jgi:hypothetical protein
VRKKCYKVQDTIVYDSNLDRVPWVVSTISCPQDSASLLPLAVLLIKVIVSFKSILLLLPNHQCCHFSAVRLNTGIFLDWPIREILSLYFLPDRTKVSLFCYSARYQNLTFRYKSRRQTTVSLIYVSVHNVAASSYIHAFCILMLPPRGMVLQ